jgi:hypothetical protein
MQKEGAHKLDLGFTLKTADLLNPIQASKNIGSFNYKSYLLNIGVRHQLKLTDFVELKKRIFLL